MLWMCNKYIYFFQKTSANHIFLLANLSKYHCIFYEKYISSKEQLTDLWIIWILFVIAILTLTHLGECNCEFSFTHTYLPGHTNSKRNKIARLDILTKLLKICACHENYKMKLNCRVRGQKSPELLDSLSC